VSGDWPGQLSQLKAYQVVSQKVGIIQNISLMRATSDNGYSMGLTSLILCHCHKESVIIGNRKFIPRFMKLQLPRAGNFKRSVFWFYELTSYTMWGYEIPGMILSQAYLRTYTLLREVTFEILPFSSRALSPNMLPYQRHNFHTTGVYALKSCMMRAEACTIIFLLRSSRKNPSELRNKINPGTWQPQHVTG